MNLNYTRNNVAIKLAVAAALLQAICFISGEHSSNLA
jgi:hypothetical protein